MNHLSQRKKSTTKFIQKDEEIVHIIFSELGT
jgi:hypothetical protein